MSKSAPMPDFSGPTHAEPVGITADRSWWEQNRPVAAGVLRVISHGALIGSGLGIGTGASAWRVAAGISGVTGASTLALYGAKPAPSAPATHRPNVIGTYAGINVLSGLCLMASGIATGRKTEALAGAWTATAFAIKKWMPENGVSTAETSMPGFDPGIPSQSQAMGVTGRAETYLEEIRHHPVKLGADMLQASAFLVLADAIAHRDPLRGVSALCLAASNYAIRETRRSDYSTPGNPSPGR